MSEKQPEQRIQVRFPHDVWQHLKDLAKEDGRSFNGEVIWILRQYITDRSRKGASGKEEKT